jgi:acyl-coenzyme A synthetase/AMP-(fatty) acid ligase
MEEYPWLKHYDEGVPNSCAAADSLPKTLVGKVLRRALVEREKLRENKP